jgi:hypothetical protein
LNRCGRRLVNYVISQVISTKFPSNLDHDELEEIKSRENIRISRNSEIFLSYPANLRWLLHLCSTSCHLFHHLHQLVSGSKLNLLNLKTLLHSKAATFRSQIDAENRGLGTWFFDKRTRKRRYVSLIGKNFVGPAAIEQAKQDKISELHPANSARAELRYLMTTMAPNSLDDLLSAGPGSQNSSSTLFNNDPLALAQWGIPLRVVNKYFSMGVTRLFPWQIECLGVDDGNVLRGGD